MSARSSSSRVLTNPWVDKGFAAVISAPLAYAIYLRLVQGQLDFVKITLVIQAVVTVATMLVRRPPKRVSINPWYWLVSFLASYWIPFPALDKNPGTALIPYWFGVALSSFSLALTLYARFSLGRNIGMVPAQRNLVTDGAYAYVRHPIYTAVFASYLSLLLLHYSSLHLVLVSMGIFWFVLRSILEERYLTSDPDYVDYMRRVRRRWIPGLV